MKCSMCKRLGLLCCKKCFKWMCSKHIQLELHTCDSLKVKQTLVLPDKIIAPKLVKI